MGRTRLLGAAALPLILVLAACSGGGASPSPTSAPSVAPSTAASTAPSTAPSTAASPSAEASPTGSDSSSSDYPLKAATGASGSYLTGKDGLSLYVFSKDSAGKSTCNGPCASAWPPYEADDASEVKAEGVSGALSIITRDDGSKQLAYNGAPLYYFGGDKAAGDTNGSAIPGWSLAKP